MSPRGFERYLADLANGLHADPTEDEAAVLRNSLAALYDITVVGPFPDRR